MQSDVMTAGAVPSGYGRARRAMGTGEKATRTEAMKNVLEYLEETAGRLPDKVAVTDPDGSLTFADLEEGARRVGSYLAGKIGPGHPVGLMMDKSREAYTALLGILYAGCYLVYLNAEQGRARLEKIAETAGLSLILTDRTDKDLDIRTLPVREALSAETDREVLDQIRDRQISTDPIYCNFTSGSTGTPKGVLVGHRSVIDFMTYFPDLFGISQEDVIGNQAPFDFDVSVKDIYSSLKTGAELVLIPRRFFTVITDLLDYLDDHRVTTLTWAVSALCLVVSFRGFSYKRPSSIRRVLFSGEVMPKRFLKAWMDQYPEADFVNLYGPSEITCNCTYYRLSGKDRLPEGEKPIPIGRAFPNEKVFLLSESNEEVKEPGQVGEICVAGDCLALGYLNAPEITERAFCLSPLAAGYPERIYRTGDLGYYREDGNLCFAGRSDFQIKLFGHRIELEEVEGALNAADGVERAFCVFHQEKNRLEGYYCGSAEPRDLKGDLQGVLPSYMIPSRLHRVEEIPLTDHGKIDRKKVLADSRRG